MAISLRRWVSCLFGVLSLLCLSAHAQPRVYDAATLEALAAPVALYPDSVISQVFAAAGQPQQVADAAARPGIDDPSWSPAVRALVPYPEVLERMAESPQWMADLSWAAQRQGAQLMEAVQMLRQRAYAAGYLRSDDLREVILSGQGIYIQALAPQVVFLPYYNPAVVYGTWRPVHPVVRWRPWPARTYFIHQGAKPKNGPPSPARQMQNDRPSPARQLQLQQQQQFEQRQQQQQRRQQLNFAPHPPARLARGEAHDHQESGRRHDGGAGRDASHARSAHARNPRLAGAASPRVHPRGPAHRA